MTITTDVLSEVIEMMGKTMSAEIKIDWLDGLIRKIHKKQECQELVLQINMLRVLVKEAETYFNHSKNLLRQDQDKLVTKRLGAGSPTNYTKKFFQSPRALK